MSNVASALNAIANRFVAYNNADPSASTPSPAPMRMPVAASGGTNATATATPGSVAETSSWAIAYAPAAPAAIATTRSRISGLVRPKISLPRSRLGSSRESTIENSRDQSDPIATTNAACTARRPRPSPTAAEKLMIGVISGAMSIAPITTATEFAARPITAIVTERVSIKKKRISHFRSWSGMSRLRTSIRSLRSKWSSSLNSRENSTSDRFGRPWFTMRC